MRSRAAVFMGLACIYGTAFSCGAFEEGTTVEAEEGGASGNDGGDSSLLDSSIKDDAALPDAGPASSPCPGDGGTLLFRSRFDEGGEPNLAGWMVAATPGTMMAALAASGGAVARGQVLADAASPSYAVIAREGILSDFAVRFSFSATTLSAGYIVHQIYSTAQGEITLSLQPSGWTLGVSDTFVVLGANGADGALHTVTYRVAPAAMGRRVVVTFDRHPPLMLDVAAVDAGSRFIQLGPFWPPPGGTSPATVVDYSDVAVWNCAP